MTEYVATVKWERGDAKFTDNRFSRVHRWEFDGGVTVPASASPQVVRPPMSSAEAVDPEEAFVVALSSCHMLWFLSIAAGKGFVVDSYVDRASGTMGPNAERRIAMTGVVLRPDVRFAGEKAPTAEEIRDMHEVAHRACFIANSVRTEVVVEPRS
jgi:organic hydroperoxide reductase OsmC/OhrA